MDYKQLIPLVGALLELGFKVAEIVDRAETVSPEDKEALKAQIKNAQSGVKYWPTDETGQGTDADGNPVTVDKLTGD